MYSVFYIRIAELEVQRGFRAKNSSLYCNMAKCKTFLGKTFLEAI